MNIVMPWFLPIGIGLGLFGLRTALVEKRMRGGRWRRDAILLVLTAWAPLVIWCLSGLLGE